MKAIIYAGIGLFSAATVYGVVDYYNTQKTESFKKLYADEEPLTVLEKPAIKNAVLAVKKNDAAVTKNIVTINTVSKKNKKPAVRKIRLDDFSRSRIADVPLVEEVKLDLPVIAEPVKEDAAQPETITPAEEKAAEVAKPERKLSLSMFSRAPLKIKKDYKKVKL